MRLGGLNERFDASVHIIVSAGTVGMDINETGAQIETFAVDHLPVERRCRHRSKRLDNTIFLKKIPIMNKRVLKDQGCIDKQVHLPLLTLVYTVPCPYSANHITLLQEHIIMLHLYVFGFSALHIPIRNSHD